MDELLLIFLLLLPSRPRSCPVECPVVIDRDEVLHVARLARLRLSEDELEPMARELSAVLDHVARIGELDLDGVSPTSHVVEVTGALRADEPRASFPREVAFSQAPSIGDDGFLVPSPQA
jgi:aspartyl-tRNA(Asn)/glutamyl-tRNA(Gln) amidotransferase subunit C